MELKVSSLKSGGLSPPDCNSDLEEKEFSDEDDDDRNHKHRRRETRSQSLERDSLEPVFTKSYRRHHKPFENGHPFRENESQGSETWKNYNPPLDKDFTSKFEKRRPGMALLPRVGMDLNQRIRSNQTFSGEHGPGRGRGRDPGSWNQRDSRFSSVDIASQIVQQGSITPGLFAGRGLPNVSNAQNASWNAFGLFPGIPNGGLDALHSIGLQGTPGPVVNSSLNMGIPRQRCRDFEERGFCLRGDMCPMEHGVNRIVVEDVQSLSQFNLPVSLPNAPLVGTPAGPGALPSVGAHSNTLIHSKGHSRISKLGGADAGMGLNGGYSGSVSVSGADLYDPDQPLWNNNGPETSNALLALHSSKNDETESFASIDPSDHQNLRLRDTTDNECSIRSTGIPVGSQSTVSSVWGRVGSMKNKLDVREKTDLTASMSDHGENEAKEDHDALANIQDTSRQGKRTITEDVGPKTIDSGARIQSDTMRNTRKSSQKALRTLFVSGIPQRNTKKDALLSHFQKFGEVIDIYIPLNSERAFVQFSKREEAESALRAPDAVMGNRFIKLWWANRDNIPDAGMSSSSDASVTQRGVGVPAGSVLPQPLIGTRGKDNLQSAVSKGTKVPPSDASLPLTDHPKPMVNGPKAPPPVQKKLDLEQLRGELRKKQEMLDQKRNDFRRQLDKLEKQATGVKDEAVAEPATKRQKVGIATDVGKTTNPRSSESVASVPSACAEMIVDKNKSVENIISSSPKLSTSLMQHESTGSRQPIRPMAPAGAVFQINRYKLDNRPTTFKIIPPLPPGLANVDALKEFFSSYGQLSAVELEDTDASNDDGDGSEVTKNCSVRLTFTTRRSAERAFLNGRCWQGNNLKFTWVTSATSGSDLSVRENIPSASRCPMDVGVQPTEKLACTGSGSSSSSGFQEAKASAFVNGEHETSESRSANHMELHEVSDPYPTSEPGENTTKCEDSATSMCSKEESPKRRLSPTAISQESESHEGGDTC